MKQKNTRAGIEKLVLQLGVQNVHRNPGIPTRRASGQAAIEPRSPAGSEGQEVVWFPKLGSWALFPPAGNGKGGGGNKSLYTLFSNVWRYFFGGYIYKHGQGKINPKNR